MWMLARWTDFVLRRNSIPMGDVTWPFDAGWPREGPVGMMMVAMHGARITLRLLADLATFASALLRPPRALAAENLFLRKQLAMYRERGVKPRHTDVATRASLVLLSRWFDWRAALVNVTPRTFLRWHRQGFQLFWRWKSRPGRAPIPRELRTLSGAWPMKTRAGGKSASPTNCC